MPYRFWGLLDFCLAAIENQHQDALLHNCRTSMHPVKDKTYGQLETSTTTPTECKKIILLLHYCLESQTPGSVKYFLNYAVFVSTQPMDLLGAV
jgi:hypothetical protein